VKDYENSPEFGRGLNLNNVEFEVNEDIFKACINPYSAIKVDPKGKIYFIENIMIDYFLDEENEQ